MGLEEVSELNDLSVSVCNLKLFYNPWKDANASRKEITMKRNGKKRIFALLMCAMLIVSSMSVWAAETELGYGGVYATCGLYVYPSKGNARTTPYISSNASICRTTISLWSDNGNSLGLGSGSTTADANSIASGAVDYGVSTHYIGTYYTSLSASS